MAEVTFARQFLAQLDARPVRLPSDWATDARQLPAQGPYILPLPSVPFPKPAPAGQAKDATAQSADSSATPQPTTTVVLKPLRGASTTLSAVPPASTSIWDLKSQCSRQTGYAPDKIKVLWERKPVADSKLLVEVVGEARAGSSEPIELGVMFVGQPTLSTEAAGQTPTQAPPAAAQAPVAQGPSGLEVIQSPDFWRDLEGFVLQRVRDEQVAREAVEVWKKASLSPST